MSTNVLRSVARRRIPILAAALVAVVSALAFASAALAKEPTGDFAVFKNCPRFTEHVEFCLYSETKSGEVKLNKQTVPITSPIILQGGIAIDPKTFEESFVGATNGETLSKTAEKVPGGLSGIVNCQEIKGEGWAEKGLRFSCELVFENTLTGVSAVTELAKPASEIGISTLALESEFGTALSLPVKVKLENPLLGSECYIGSSTHPLMVNLTTGTTEPSEPNKPISGKFGKVSTKDEFNFIELTENTLVNNEFSAPEATGCGGIFSFLLDPIINSKLGLPSADGHNTIIQNNRILQGTKSGVIKSEK